MKIVITALCTVAALSLAPAAQADGNSANLDAIVGQAYTQFMRGCVPTQASQFQRIVWDNDGPGGQGGSGRIIDGSPGMGGPFQVYWNLGGGPFPGAQKIVPAQPQGYWDIVFEFC
jgi:hypothetical protein